MVQRDAQIVQQIRQIGLYPRGVLIGLKRARVVAGIDQGVAKRLPGSKWVLDRRRPPERFA